MNNTSVKVSEFIASDNFQQALHDLVSTESFVQTMREFLHNPYVAHPKIDKALRGKVCQELIDADLSIVALGK